MKKINLTILGWFAVLSVWAMGNTPEVKLTIHVVDSEVGIPLSNACVRTRFLIKEHWDKADEYAEQEKLTDEDGVCILEGEDLSPGQSGRAVLDGFYTSHFKLAYTGKNKILNRWEPWNPTIEVRLRKIKNPIPMVQKYIEWKLVPNIGGTVGYDLEAGDWVAPHGKGKISDFILTTSSYMQDVKKGSEARYTLSFSNEKDGIQIYQFPEELQSSFKWPYQAPLDGYRSTLEKYRHWDVNGMPNKTNYAEKDNYIFRVRSRELEDGSIEACYGMIEGELEYIPQGKIRFSYWFNPIPNERSLEYSGENLLKK